MDQEALAVAYGVDRVLGQHAPRYNIAPTDTAPALLSGEQGLQVESLRWGLVPHWAKDPAVGNRLINARAETVRARNAFRDAWQRNQRCVILADGFYEWRSPPSGKGPRIPFWITIGDRRPFGLAGLWEVWRDKDRELRTFTILTTDSNDTVRPIHDRMPVVLGDKALWDAWANPATAPEKVAEMLRPYPDDDMRAERVSTYVNKPGNEGPECLARLD